MNTNDNCKKTDEKKNNHEVHTGSQSLPSEGAMKMCPTKETTEICCAKTG